MLQVDPLIDFLVKVEDLAKKNGIEIKTDEYGTFLWPTYDKNGALSPWFCLYIKTQETQNELRR